MKLKHMLTQKEQTQPPLLTFVDTYWLATYLYNLSSDYNYFKSNNRIKAFNLKTPFCYCDLVDYIKNQDNTIIKEKPITKTIYQTMLNHGCKEHTIFGETLWKNKVFNIYFAKYGNILTILFVYHTTLTYITIYYTAQLKQMNTHINVVEIKPISPYCDFCNIAEAILHLLINCTTIKTIWTRYHSYYQKITNKRFTPYQHIITISSNSKDKQTKKLSTLTKCICYEIWQSRNNIKYKTTITKINSYVPQLMANTENRSTDLDLP